MPRWGAERRARPLHEVRAASVLPQSEDRREGARRIPFRCGPVDALLGAPPPFFQGRSFLAWLFLASAKLGCEGASRQQKDSSSPGLTRLRGPKPSAHEEFGLLRRAKARRSIGLGRILIGPRCNRPPSMDHRVKPGGDEERSLRDGPAIERRAKLFRWAHPRRAARGRPRHANRRRMLRRAVPPALWRHPLAPADWRAGATAK
jgi:hypothetical protein